MTGPAARKEGEEPWYEPEPEPEPEGAFAKTPKDVTRFFAAVIALVIAAGAWMWWTDLRFPRGPIEGVLPLGPEAAAMVVVTPDGDWLVRFDRDGGRRWAARLGDFEPWTPRGGATLAEGVLTVRERQGEALRTHGLSVDGEALWTAGEGPYDGTIRAPRYVADVGGGSLVWAIRETKPPTVIALDRATGAERWRAQLPRDVVARAWARGEALWLDQGAAFAVVEGGAVRTIEASAGGCVVGDTIWTQPPDAGALRRSRAGATDTLADVPWRLAGLCGTYDGLVVAAATEGAHALVVGFDDSGERWRLDLGPAAWAIPGQEARLTQPEQLSWSGELTPFLPVQIAVAAGEIPPVSVVMLDLAKREVAWRSAPDDALAQYQLVADAGRHFLYRRNVIASFDGASGELLAAKKLPGEHGLVMPYHLVGGVVWVYRDTGVAALDGATLDALPGVWGELTIAEGKAEMAQALAPAPPAPVGPAP